MDSFLRGVLVSLEKLCRLSAPVVWMGGEWVPANDVIIEMRRVSSCKGPVTTQSMDGVGVGVDGRDVYLCCNLIFVSFSERIHNRNRTPFTTDREAVSCHHWHPLWQIPRFNRSTVARKCRTLSPIQRYKGCGNTFRNVIKFICRMLWHGLLTAAINPSPTAYCNLWPVVSTTSDAAGLLVATMSKQ